jgi:hypothetical protein
MARLGILANARGHQELTAVCLPSQDTIFRTAVNAGLKPEKPVDGVVRIPLG